MFSTLQATLHRDTYGQSLLIEEDAAAIKVGGLREENSAAPEGLLAESAEMLALQREQRKLQEAAQATDKAASKTEPQLPRGVSDTGIPDSVIRLVFLHKM